MFLLEVIASAGPDALGGGFDPYSFVSDNAVLIGFIVSMIWGWLSSQGYKGIAAVNEVKVATKANLAPNQAKAMAVALLRKYLPFLPVWLAEAIIQFLFDRMKTTSKTMEIQ